MPFNFTCPKCGYTMEVDNSAAGELCTCSQCEAEVTIARDSAAVVGTGDEPQGAGGAGPSAARTKPTASEESDKEINPAVAFVLRLIVIAILIGSVTGGAYAIYYGFTVPWTEWSYRGYVNIDDVERGYSDHQLRLIEDAKQNTGPPDYSHLKVDLPPPTEEEINMGMPDGSNGFGGGSGAEGGGQGGSGSRGGFDPEAIFTRLDENGDGQLEGDEISDRLSQRMEQTDTNSDGKISREEFLAAIRQRSRGGSGGDNPGIPQP